MIEFILNGKDISKGDLNILICKDNILNEMEMKLFVGNEEMSIDDKNAEISVSINVTSEDDLETIYEDSQDIQSSMETIQRAYGIIKNELDNIKKKYENLSQEYVNLCNMSMQK
ncbi:MAG: hypothetical protein V3G42_02225 [Oscillospiraceae bacterium]